MAFLGVHSASDRLSVVRTQITKIMKPNRRELFSMKDFTYEALPMRVRFAAGSLAILSEELEAIGVDRVLVLSTPEQEEVAWKVADILGEACAGVFSEAQMHVPIESARAAREKAQALNADGCLAIGGGSTTGLGKAIALEYNMPIIAVPTTYAGSEMTPVWGLTENEEKTTGRDPKVLPTSVVYDPELTLSLPVDMSVASGFNAIAHAAEALYAPDASPIVSLMAEEGVRALLAALPVIVESPNDLKARSNALYGAWLCGATLGATTMSLHHKLCHTLGGTFNLRHAETHTVLLPYVLAYNLGAAPQALAALQRATGDEDPAAFIRRTSLELGAPKNLGELGLTAKDIDTVVAMSNKNLYSNPRPVTEDAIRAIVSSALTGEDISIRDFSN